MLLSKKSLKLFTRDTSGLAALEFSFIAPVMIALFFGIIEGADALSASRRTVLAVNTLADLAAQETELDNSDLADLFTGVEDIVDTRQIEIEFRLVSVVFDPNDQKIKVDWSRDSNNGTPYAADSEFTNLADQSLLDDTSSLVVAEVTYAYRSALTQFFIDRLNFEKQASRWPRRSVSVTYCGSQC